MTRSRASAKGSGAKFERDVADYLRDNLSEFIDKQVKMGAKDLGDIANVRTQNGRKVVLELKEYGGRLLPAEWIKEAEVERDNANAFVGFVVAKRKGTTDPGKQWVIGTLEELAKLLKGEDL
jgi:hypothetical protein